MKKKERRALRMHPRLLWDVITKQAGTLQKAILEGVMNSIDAGSTFCRVTIDRKSFTIEDDGKGFVSEDEIANFFETFGYPHEAGDSTYGRFRMGRGQLFAFGANDWFSNTFEMKVDLKPQENSIGKDGGQLMYDFSAGHAPVKGCRIEVNLYEQLKPSDLDGVLRELRAAVKWAQIPVTINGTLESEQPANAKWTEETDDAWIQVNDKTTIDVYNLGVLVCRIPAYRYGSGGTVVSKKQLEVNFARNDIQNTCPVWKCISKKLVKDSTERAAKKPKLTDGERENLAHQLLSGELDPDDVRSIRLLTDVMGQNQPLTALDRISTDYSNRLMVADTGDRLGERAHQRGLAFVLAQSTLDRFEAKSAADFVKKLMKVTEHSLYSRGIYYSLKAIKVVKRAEMEKLLPDSHHPLDEKELNPRERIAVKALGYACRHIAYEVRKDKGNDRWTWRRVRAGVSETADAWTDGSSTIWFNRPKLALLEEGLSGSLQLIAILVHELMHDDSDMGSHIHDDEFYRRHHDLMCDNPEIGKTVESLTLDYLALLRKETGKKPSRKLARTEDKMASRGLEVQEDASAVLKELDALMDKLSTEKNGMLMSARAAAVRHDSMDAAMSIDDARNGLAKAIHDLQRAKTQFNATSKAKE